MKALVALSLLLNAVLLVALLRGTADVRVKVPSPPAPAKPVATQLERRARHATVLRAPVNPWQALAAGDYRSLIAQLRAAGCPEETLRDLVVIRLARQTRDRLITGEMEFFTRTDWWRNPVTDADNLEMQRAQRHARVQMRFQIEDLLGVPAEELTANLVGFPTPARDSWLAPEKRRDLARLLDRFDDEYEEIRGGRRGQSGGALTASQRQQLAELRQRQRGELEQVLTPAELQAYDVRNSDAAKYVMQKLPAAQSEAEFARMVQIAQEMKLVPTYLRDDDSNPSVRVEEERERRDAEDLKHLRERLKTMSGTNTIAADEQAQVDLATNQKADDKARHEVRALKEAAEMVQAAGLDVSLAQKFLERMTAAGKEFDRENDESKMNEAQRKETLVKAKALFENIAVEVFGERGRELLKQMEKKEKGR